MRRTVIIGNTLLMDAQRVLGTSGIRDTVEEALRQVIRRDRLEQLRNSFCTINLGFTFVELTSLRAEE